MSKIGFISFCFIILMFKFGYAANDKRESRNRKNLKKEIKELKKEIKELKKTINTSEKPKKFDLKRLIKKPRSGFRKKNMAVKNWNPPTSLSTHFGWGTVQKNSPVFNFNLNLGYVRYYMRSDSTGEKVFTQNSDFSFIIELKPFDFVSFLSSGSRYSLFVEQNDWLRNLTFIVSNKIYSSTQFITADMLWYFDVLYDGLLIPNVVIDLNDSPTTGLDHLYSPNRRITVGISDRIHLYRSPTWALGMAAYFEFHIPQGNEQVFTDPSGNFGGDRFSSAFTYGALGGVFFRMKKESMEINSKILFHRFEGTYDGVKSEIRIHTISARFEVSFNKRYFIRTHYYAILGEPTTGGDGGSKFFSHTILGGLDIKGFGNGIEWLGLGFDASYQIMGRESTRTGFNNDLTGILLIPSVSLYPLAIHNKNHQLKVSFLYAFINYSWTAYKVTTTAIEQSEAGWNTVFMGRIEYSF